MGRRVLAIAAALLVALLGAAGVVVYAQSADARAVAGQATQQVYIAAAPVPEGTSAGEAVAQKLLVLQSVVAKGVPAGALTSVTGGTGALVATSTISQGEIVLASRFGHLADQQPTGPVPEGKVAITVSLADPQRVATLLTPGRTWSSTTPSTRGTRRRRRRPRTAVTCVTTRPVSVPRGSCWPTSRSSAWAARWCSPRRRPAPPPPRRPAAERRPPAALVTVAVTRPRRSCWSTGADRHPVRRPAGREADAGPEGAHHRRHRRRQVATGEESIMTVLWESDPLAADNLRMALGDGHAGRRVRPGRRAAARRGPPGVPARRRPRHRPRRGAATRRAAAARPARASASS